MRIATWNVNSIRTRLPRVLRWLETASPDVACLQEIKVVDEKFPRAEIEELGYHVAVHGQPTYNGVAVLSRLEAEAVRRGVVVVAASRTGSGRVVETTQHREMGVIPGDNLLPHKARILLQVALASGYSDPDIRRIFESY